LWAGLSLLLPLAGAAPVLAVAVAALLLNCSAPGMTSFPSLLLSCLQVSQLTRLHTLSLDAAGYDSDGYSPLRALTSSLRRLALVDCSHLPACLPELTALDALLVFDHASHLHDEASSGDIAVAALPRLAHLTFLALEWMPSMDQPPAALTSLTSLRSFHWWADQQEDEAALPAGPWLSGLERLETHVQVLNNSLPALQSASRLQHLGVECDEESSLEQLSPLLSWAASHPTLQRLVLDAKPELRAAAFTAVCAAQRRNPRLAIEGDDNREVLAPAVMHESCFGPPF